MKTTVLALTVLLSMSLSISAQENQNRWAFEFNSGVSFATQKINNTSLKTGFGFEGTFHYRFLPHTGIYAGWGWNSFDSDESNTALNLGYEETGYLLGLNFKHPIGSSGLSYYLRMGASYKHIEIENSDGDIIADSGHGLGYQLAGGIDIKLNDKWSITPGVQFNSLSRDIELEGLTKALEYQYMTARIGFAKTF